MKHSSHNIRAVEFQTNPNLDRLIELLRDLLTPQQRILNEAAVDRSYPILGIIGCSRSGGTLLSQLLAATGLFAYPSNFLARFAYAPAIGALIQKMLFDPDFQYRDELILASNGVSLDSCVGKTAGALNVNEFFHFWRRHLHCKYPMCIKESKLQSIDVFNLRNELQSISGALEKPFAGKAKMVQYNIPYFANAIPEFIFLNIVRKPLYNMQSLLLSRRKYFVGDDQWLGVRPPQYDALSEESVYKQVAGQVYYTQSAVSAGLAGIGAKRYITISYESLCRNPLTAIRSILSLAGLSITDEQTFMVPKSLICANINKVDVKELDFLMSAYAEIASA